VNRRKNELIAIETAILAAALQLLRDGQPEFHGFLLAKTIEGAVDGPSLLGHGTLYKALKRLEERGFLTSRWEGQVAGDRTRGARRRLYTLTVEGQRAGLGVPRSAPRQLLPSVSTA